MRIAVMQPYFIPYAGYFRLFHAADVFVVFDCVQFIRRGWIHRNRLPRQNNELDWLTLPLKKAPQTVTINQLEFSETAEENWQERLDMFPQLRKAGLPLLKTIQKLHTSPLHYIINTLQETCRLLSLPFNIIYSSQFNLCSSIKGEERIIAIAKQLEATTYINPPGGKLLYNPDNFARHNINLQFLTDYQGSYDSILQRLLINDAHQIRNEIINQTVMETL